MPKATVATTTCRSSRRNASCTLLALLVGKPGVVGSRLDAGRHKSVRHLLDPLSGAGRRRFRPRPAAAGEKVGQLGERFLLFDHRVADVRPVEAGDVAGRAWQVRAGAGCRRGSGDRRWRSGRSSAPPGRARAAGRAARTPAGSRAPTGRCSGPRRWRRARSGSSLSRSRKPSLISRSGAT